MDRQLISQALGGIADRHIEAALREGGFDMGKHIHLRPIAVLAAAAALLLALGATAYGAGWLDSIFGQAARMFNTNDDSENRIEAAAAAVSEAPPEPETQELPAFDGGRLTLRESWYDGRGLLLGVDLEGVRPDPVVGYEPDGALLERIVQPGNTYQFYYSTAEDLERMRQDIEANYQGTADYAGLMAQVERQEAALALGDPDDLDNCLAAGTVDQSTYDEDMGARTERGAAAGLHHLSAICLDAFLERELTGEEYEDLWQLLERDGAACVVLQDVYIGDHMLVEGVDIAAMQTDVEAGTFVEAQTPGGNGGAFSAELPEEQWDLDQVNVRLKVKGRPVYYYMTLDGRAYALADQAEEQMADFTVPNSAK